MKKAVIFEIIKNNYFVISFEKLSHLPDGWFEGAGKAPNITDLQNIAEIFIDQYPEKMPFPSIVPTLDGNILLEWESDNMPSVDIIISSKMAFFHAFGQDGADIEKEFQLNTHENIQMFFNFLSHALIDFHSSDSKKWRKLAKQLKRYAVERGRLYPLDTQPIYL